MKKSMAIIVSGILTIQSVGYAQVIPANVNTVGGNSSFLTAGQYDIKKVEANFTDVLTQIVKDKALTDIQDREYLANKGKIVGDSLRELVTKKLAFEALANKSITSITTPLEEYLTQMNEINAVIEKAKIDIQESSLISADTLPSATVSANGMNVTTAQGSIINMSKAMAPFVATLDDLTKKINNVKFKVLMHKGGPIEISANALSPDLSRVPRMTGAEIQEALLEIQAKQMISKTSQEQQQLLADKTVNFIKKYVELTGVKEFLRLDTVNTKNSIQEVYKTLENIFFTRSYLRKKYGLPIGAIQPKSYPMQPLNVEGIFNKEMLLPITGALNNIVSQTAKTDEDLMEAFNNARQFVEFYDRALTPILADNATEKREKLKDEQIEKDALLKNASLWERARSQAKYQAKKLMTTFATENDIMSTKPVYLDEEGKNVAYNSEDTGVIARMSGLMTRATGQVSTVKSLLAVMRLVLADIREEVMLSQGDWSTLKSYHGQRFMATATQTARAVKLMCDIDVRLSNAARAQAKAFTNGKVSCEKPPTGLLANQNTGGKELTIFRNLVNSYETVDMKNAQDARNLQMLVEQSIKAQSNAGDEIDDTSLFQ